MSLSLVGKRKRRLPYGSSLDKFDVFLVKSDPISSDGDIKNRNPEPVDYHDRDSDRIRKEAISQASSCMAKVVKGSVEGRMEPPTRGIRSRGGFKKMKNVSSTTTPTSFSKDVTRSKFAVFGQHSSVSPSSFLSIDSNHYVDDSSSKTVLSTSMNGYSHDNYKQSLATSHDRYSNSVASQGSKSFMWSEKSQLRSQSKRVLLKSNSFIVDATENDSDSGTDEQSSCKKRRNAGSQHLVLQSPEHIIGFGRDTSDGQDAGSLQFLKDECFHLCTTILGSLKNCGVVEHNAVTADACCELALLLSDAKTRAVLLNPGLERTINTEFLKNDQPENNIMAVLNTFTCVPSISSHSSSDISFIRSRQSDMYALSRSKKSRILPQVTTCTTRSIESAGVSLRSMDYDLVVFHALAIVAFFITVDCVSPKSFSACTTRKAAIALRKVILSHQPFVKGVSLMLLCDPRPIHYLKGYTAISNMTETVRNTGNRTSIDETNLIDASVLVSECSEITKSADSSTLEREFDPTKLGRMSKFQKRKVVRATGNESKLQSIYEASETGKKMKCGDHKCDRTLHDIRNLVDDLAFPSSPQTKNQARKWKGPSKISTLLWQKIDIAVDRVPIPSELQHVLHGRSQTTCPLCKSVSADHTRSVNHTPSSIALQALHQLLSEECFLIDNETDECNETDNTHDDLTAWDLSPDGPNKTNEVESSVNNPLFFKNTMLHKGDAIPSFVKAMSVNIQAAANVCHTLLGKNSNAEDIENGIQADCINCITGLQHQIQILSTIIDGACCLSESNRKNFCETRDNCGESLVISLLRFISAIRTLLRERSPAMDFEPRLLVLCDVSISVLRTLTSLTHENETAASHILNFVCDKERSNGVSELIYLLYFLVDCQLNLRSESKTTLLTDGPLPSKDKVGLSFYDAIIFILNSLTNVAETSSLHRMRKSIVDIYVGKEEAALVWLTKWIVSQTDPFRDALLAGTIGGNMDDAKEGTKHSFMRRCEGECLITAGNGFILLSCLMRESLCRGVETRTGIVDPLSTNREKDLILQIRKTILSEIPILDPGDPPMSTKFMVKTMKAFCNYYHYSVGDLSIAVIEPVLNLMKDLDGIKLI